MDNSYEPLIFFLGVVIFILLRIATYPLLPSDYYTNDNLSELPNSFAKYVNDHPPQDSIALTNYIIKSMIQIAFILSINFIRCVMLYFK